MVACPRRSVTVQTVTRRAIYAAKGQHSTTPAESYGQIRARSLAADLIRIDSDLAVIEREITGMLMRHEHAEMLLSVPGFGPILAADFIANTGGDMSAFGTCDRLASVAGLAPEPRDSGGESVGTYTDLNATTAGCCAPVSSRRCPA